MSKTIFGEWKATQQVMTYDYEVMKKYAERKTWWDCVNRLQILIVYTPLILE